MIFIGVTILILIIAVCIIGRMLRNLNNDLKSIYGTYQYEEYKEIITQGYYMNAKVRFEELKN